jgi:hypothetical protein
LTLLLQRLRDWRDRVLRGCDLRRNEECAESGASIRRSCRGSRSAEAEIPATEGQAEQQRVDQQGEQQRKRQAPSFKTHALVLFARLHPVNLRLV